MSPARAVALLLAAVTPALAGEAASAGSSPHEMPLPAVQMRLIEEGKSLPIDLATGLALAQANNLDILAARAHLADARGVRNESLGYLVPEYHGSFTANRIDGEIQASFGNLERHTFNTFIPATGAALTLNPGRVVFDALAAHRSLAAAEHDSEQVTQDVLATVAQQYFALQEAQARIKIAEEALAASRQLARVGRDREAEGAGLKVDVARAEARAAADEVRLAEAERRLRNASVRLALTLKTDPAVMLFPLETVVRQRAIVDPTRPLEELTTRAAGSRPDLAAQLRRVTAAESRHTATWAGAVGPTIAGSVEESAVGERVSNLGERQIYGGFIGFRLSPASIGQVQAAKARVEQARLAEERLAQQVTGDVIMARESVLTAGEQIEAALGGLRAAEAAFELSQVRFKGGVGIGLEVLDAQAALSEARSNVVTAIVTYDVAQVALLRALGGVSVPALLQQADAGGPPSP
ncbi:MAG: TolC family protein [Candidatus Binatia bacterium]